MRPRGLSSSSPVKRKVGQVAVQKPQCTQARRIFSDCAMSGFSRRAGGKCVCIGSELRAKPAALQNMRGIEAFLHAAGERCERGRLRLKDADAGSDLVTRAQKRRLAVELFRERAQHAGLRVLRALKAKPDEAARPVIEMRDRCRAR